MRTEENISSLIKEIACSAVAGRFHLFSQWRFCADKEAVKTKTFYRENTIDEKTAMRLAMMGK